MLSEGSDPGNPPKQTFELIFFLNCLHASVTELRHICISKRWGSKLPLMKAAKVKIKKCILSTLWFFALLHLSSLRWDKKKLWNTSLVPIQWAKPHDATKMPQLLCVKLEDPKKITSQALRRSRAVIHLAKPPQSQLQPPQSSWKSTTAGAGYSTFGLFFCQETFSFNAKTKQQAIQQSEKSTKLFLFPF